MDEIRVICSVIWEWFAVVVWTLFGRMPPGSDDADDSS